MRQFLRKCDGSCQMVRLHKSIRPPRGSLNTGRVGGRKDWTLYPQEARRIGACAQPARLARVAWDVISRVCFRARLHLRAVAQGPSPLETERPDPWVFFLEAKQIPQPAGRALPGVNECNRLITTVGTASGWPPARESLLWSSVTDGGRPIEGPARGDQFWGAVFMQQQCVERPLARPVNK